MRIFKRFEDRRESMVYAYNEAKIIRDEVRRDCDHADGARIFRHNDDDLSHILPALLDWYQASSEVQDPAEWFATLHSNYTNEDAVPSKRKGKATYDDDLSL